MLNAQFLHVGVLRGRYRVHVGPAKHRPEASKQVYLSPNVHLFGFGQTVPPSRKFIGKLYFPFLQRNIPPKAFSVQGTRQIQPNISNNLTFSLTRSAKPRSLRPYVCQQHNPHSFIREN
jgi:hypothetical protein